jgi:hypothetical protein
MGMHPNRSLLEMVAHLTDGREVLVPYAWAGHYSRSSPKASPVVRTLLGKGPAHPFSGVQTVVVELVNGRTWVLNPELLAHHRSCEMCAPIWERLGARLDDIPVDGMLFAAAELHLTSGPAFLLVDVEDLDGRSTEDGVVSGRERV